MDESNATSDFSGSFSRMRIWLCGPFQMEWSDVATGETQSFTEMVPQGKDVAQALSLLTLLLCQPNRQAYRDWILEQFWPESPQSTASHRFENVVSCLRKLLRSAPSGEEFLHATRGNKNKGMLYSLDAYPHIWVDVDAIQWNVEQAARMQRFDDDCLPYWQRAFDLLKRGLLLINEPYAEWVNEHRDRLDGLSRHCVHTLWRLYVERQGEAGKAEALLLLRTYWQQHQTDEDVLRPLLELLGEQERYQEAEQYYQHFLLALAELGPDEDAHPRVPDTRTRDIREYLRTKQIRRERIQSNTMKTTEKIEVPISLDQRSKNHTLESGIALMKEDRRRFLQYVLDLTGSGVAASPPFFEIASSEQIIEAIMSTPKVDDFMLTQFETITRSHWYLFLRASSKSDLLNSFLGHLRTIIHFLKYPQSGVIRNRLYSIGSESSQMIGEILFDMQDYHHAQTYYDFSIYAAKEAGNNALRAVGLGRLSFLPIYRDEPQKAYPLLQEAKQLLTANPRPMIQDWLSVVEAEVAAHLHNEVACEQALERATVHYQREGSEEDKLWTRLNDATIPGYKGACYLQLQQPQKALLALKETLTFIPEYSLRHRSLILADMASAMQQMQEVKDACLYLYDALEITMQTKSLMVLMRMQHVRKGLEPWKETSYVQQLDVRIREVLPSILS